MMRMFHAISLVERLFQIQKINFSTTSDQCLRVEDSEFMRLTFISVVVLDVTFCNFIIAVNCSFDKNYCGWRNMLTSLDDQIIWYRKKSGNQSQGTGQSHHHTGKLNALNSKLFCLRTITAFSLQMLCRLKCCMKIVGSLCSSCFLHFLSVDKMTFGTNKQSDVEEKETRIPG